VNPIVEVILDANFLMAPGEIGVNVFQGIEEAIEKNYSLTTTEPVKTELQKISKNKGGEGRAARLALELIERKNINIEKTKRMTGDASLVELAGKKEEPVVATNDKKLRKQFRKVSVPTLYIRTNDHVELEGALR